MSPHNVFRVKASRGCGVCRTFKRRCDQQIPYCGQCTRRHEECPGYRDDWELIFRDQTNHTINRSREKRAKRSKEAALAKTKHSRPLADDLSHSINEIGDKYSLELQFSSRPQLLESTGRECDDYDRLPVRKRALSFTPVTTMDERRCFSYFLYCSIPGLGAFFDSPVWQKIILQISHVDPAVYHASNMLGAVHEDSDANGMRLSGENLKRARHRFALQQASRAYTHLSQRQSNSPQDREVILVCCLLFVLSELLLGQYDKAFQHLHSGLRILKEAQDYHSMIGVHLVHIFERLDIESSHFGPGTPFLFINDNVHTLDHFSRMQTISDVHQSVTLLLNMGIPFLARCWPSSAIEIAAEYNELFQKQQQILSLNYEFQHHMRIFYRDFYHTLRDRDKLGVDLLQLQSLGQILSLKTCLIKGPVPASLTPEYMSLLSAHQAFLAKSFDRPTFTLDYGVIPGLWVVASQCPDYSIRLQAIYTLQTWPHCEGIINSNVIVSMALNYLKAELRTRGQLYSSIIDADMEEELSRFLFDILMSTQRVTNWSFIRGTDLISKYS